MNCVESILTFRDDSGGEIYWKNLMLQSFSYARSYGQVPPERIFLIKWGDKARVWDYQVFRASEFFPRERGYAMFGETEVFSGFFKTLGHVNCRWLSERIIRWRALANAVSRRWWRGSDVFIVSDFGFANLSAFFSARPPPLALKQVDLLSLGEIITKRGFTTTPLALKPLKICSLSVENSTKWPQRFSSNNKRNYYRMFPKIE